MVQYSALRCVSGIWQNNEKPLISNGLRSVVAYLLTAALWVLFHTARHTAATLLLYHNTPLTTIKEILGHANIRTTETYADINEATIYNSISKIRFRELEKAEKRIARTFSCRS